jgi:putative endonuclease
MPTARTRLGDLGEAAAQRFLLGKGYKVLAAKYRCRWGEVDLVAQDGPELVFVEVRTRRSTVYGTPEESLTPAKARRLLASSQHYLQRLAAPDTPWRIDLVTVRVERDGLVIHHLPHAIEQ